MITIISLESYEYDFMRIMFIIIIIINYVNIISIYTVNSRYIFSVTIVVETGKIASQNVYFYIFQTINVFYNIYTTVGN